MKVINPVYKAGRNDVYQRGLNADYHLPRTAKQERQNAEVLALYGGKSIAQQFREEAAVRLGPSSGGYSEALHPRDRRGRFRNK